MTYNYDEQDPDFIPDLIDSKEAVEKAASMLSNLGYPVIIRPTFIRPDPSEMSEYADDGDIEILQRVEVKRRPELHFKSVKDFPYDTVIVDVAHAYDKAKPKPYAYLIFNSDLSAVMVVKCATKPLWEKKEKMDRKKNRMRTFYECPINLVTVHSVQ